MARISGDVFAHEMTRTSKIFGRDGKLRVILGGDEAKTDGHTVILPGVAPTAEIDEFEARVLRGYVDHEAAHQRHTDMAGQWLKKAHKRNPMLKQVLEGMEDLRIEALAVDEYAGAKNNLQATSEAAVREINELIKNGEKPTDPKALLPLAIAMGGRVEELQYSIPAIDDLKAEIDPQIWDTAMEYAKKAVAAGSTGDIYDLALELVPEEDPQEDEDEGDGDGMGPGLGNGVNKTVEGIDGNDGGGRGDEGGIFAREFDTVVELDPNTKLYRVQRDILWAHVDRNKVLATQGEVADAQLVRLLANAGNPHPHTVVYEENQIGQMVAEYERLKDSINGSILQIKSSFERYFLAKMNRGWETAQPSGRLDPKRLASVLAGAQNVFRVREDVNELDTCVGVTIDMSGSMGGSKMMLAKQALIAIAEALDKMRIPFYLQGHEGSGGYVQGEVDGIQGHEIYASPCFIAVPKPFNARLADCRAGIGSMKASGGTPEGSGVSYLLEALRFRPEKKKIAIVLTDGGPNGGAEEKLLEHLIEKTRRDRKVNMFAVGICSDEVRHYYQNQCVVVNDPSELAGQLFKHLKTAMDTAVAA